jgi:hypothetical protein
MMAIETPMVDAGQSGFVILEAKVGSGESVGALVDTGDIAPYPVLVTPRLAVRLGLKATGPARCIAAPLGEGRVCFIPTSLAFTIAGIGGPTVRAAISPQVADVAARMGDRFEAVIGGRFLKDHRVSFDYRRHRVVFDGPAPLSEPATLARVRSPAVMADVRLNGRGPFRFVVDTAAADTIATQATAARAQMTSGSATELYGPGATTAGLLVRGVQLCSARLCRSDVNVKVAAMPGAVDRLGSSFGGVLGVALLSTGVVTIDYPRHHVWLERSDALPQSEYVRPGSEAGGVGVTRKPMAFDPLRFDAPDPKAVPRRLVQIEL